MTRPVKTFDESLNSVFTRTFDLTSTMIYAFPAFSNGALVTTLTPEDDNDFGWKYHEIANIEACIVRIDPSTGTYASDAIHVRCDGFNTRINDRLVSEYASAAAAMPVAAAEGWVYVNKDTPLLVRGHTNLSRLRMYAPSGTITVAIETLSISPPGV